MPDQSVAERIQQRRHQMLVHSILYYDMDSPVLMDYMFDKWALELAALQRDNPEASESVAFMRDEFMDWTGDGGSHLPLKDPRGQGIARRILSTKEAR